MNHGIGIVDGLLSPAGFDPAGTLVRRERLARRDGHFLYEGFWPRPPRDIADDDRGGCSLKHRSHQSAAAPHMLFNSLNFLVLFMPTSSSSGR